MTIDYRSLAKHSIKTLTPYQPGKPIEELERELGITNSIKLASNENPLGASPHALNAAREALSHSHIYPDGGGYELKNALSDYLSLEMNQLTLGNGSENILELIIKAYLNETHSAVISQYAFLTIPILIQSYGAKAHVIPAKNWGHDIDGMIQAVDETTKIIFLVNPNNPTGTYTTKSDFEKLMQSVPAHVLVVVDEAYSEYISKPDYATVADYLKKYPNLIISRTFSKVHGLAALRLGYAMSSPEIADILNRARLPFNVNSIASKAAIAALKDVDHVNRSVELNNRGLQQLANGLTELGFDFIPSIANFITVDVGDAVAVYQTLLKQGVIVRPLQAYGMPKHIRVSIGTESELNRFLKSIKSLQLQTTGEKA